MPDITMCKGTNCPLASTCYRAQANPSIYMQSFFMDVPTLIDGKCTEYWECEPPPNQEKI